MTRLVFAVECYLKKYGISKIEAAKEMGLHPSTLGKFLNGESLSQETYSKIATWLLQPH